MVGHGRPTGIINMFNIIVHPLDNKSYQVTQRCNADTLSDTEGFIKSIIDRLYPDKAYIIIYRGDLTYEIYEVNEPMAIVEIRSIG